MLSENKNNRILLLLLLLLCVIFTNIEIFYRVQIKIYFIIYLLILPLKI